MISPADVTAALEPNVLVRESSFRHSAANPSIDIASRPQNCFQPEGLLPARRPRPGFNQVALQAGFVAATVANGLRERLSRLSVGAFALNLPLRLSGRNFASAAVQGFRSGHRCERSS